MTETLRIQWINAAVRLIIKNAIVRREGWERHAANPHFWPYESTPRLVDIARSVGADVQEEADRLALVGKLGEGLTREEREILLDAADFAVKLFKRERLI